MPKPAPETEPAWFARIRDFEGPDNRRALIQVADTVLPYLAMLVAMLFLARLGLPFWATILLALPAGALLVRTFILFHDCCHGSFLAPQRANDAFGEFLGLLVFTPFADWRRSHGIHHGTAGNLDHRGLGDVWTMTVAEYRGSGFLRRLQYRFYRNPLTLFVLGPFFIFVLMNRFPSSGARRRQVRGHLVHNLLLVAIGAGLSLAFGLGNYLLVQGSILFFGGIAGIWMFYVQHQFEPSYWSRDGAWSSLDAALEGSSWYRLPKAFQWITGNIGIHHVHHLSPRIPNYRLQDCLDGIPELRAKEPLRFLRSLRSVSLNLWDEEAGSLVSFRSLGRPVVRA